MAGEVGEAGEDGEQLHCCCRKEQEVSSRERVEVRRNTTGQYGTIFAQVDRGETRETWYLLTIGRSSRMDPVHHSGISNETDEHASSKSATGGWTIMRLSNGCDGRLELSQCAGWKVFSRTTLRSAPSLDLVSGRQQRDVDLLSSLRACQGPCLQVHRRAWRRGPKPLPLKSWPGHLENLQ